MIKKIFVIFTVLFVIGFVGTFAADHYLLTDESYAKDAAQKVSEIVQHPSRYGATDSSILRHPNINGKYPYHIYGLDSREMFVEIETIGDIGWPTVAKSVKVTFVRKDGTINILHESLDQILD